MNNDYVDEEVVELMDNENYPLHVLVSLLSAEENTKEENDFGMMADISTDTETKGVTLRFDEKSIELPLNFINYETIAEFFEIHDKDIFLYINTENVSIHISQAKCGLIEDGDTVGVVAKNHRTIATDTEQNGVTLSLKDKKIVLLLKCINYETVANFFEIYGKDIFLYINAEDFLIHISQAQCGLIADGDTVGVVVRDNPKHSEPPAESFVHKLYVRAMKALDYERLHRPPRLKKNTKKDQQEQINELFEIVRCGVPCSTCREKSLRKYASTDYV